MKTLTKYAKQADQTDLKSRLKSYTALAAAGSLFAPQATQAGIVYFDLNPDVTLAVSGQFLGLDLDRDNVDDVFFGVQTGLYAGVYPYGLAATFAPVGNAIAGNIYSTGGQNFPTPFALTNNTLIGPGSTFNAGSGIPGAPGASYQTLGLNLYNIVTVGNWLSATDRFFGIRFKINGNDHYGWIRLDISVTPTSPVIVIKDYAYDDVPNTPIRAGITASTPAGIASNVLATDVSDNSNGTDLLVSFNRAADETTVGQYRIIVVKDANATGFNLAAANAVPMSNYTSVTPTGNNISQTLSASARDSDGALITIGVPYRVFVLSVADGTFATSNALSNPSSVITLISAGQVPADVASNVLASDVGNNGNGTDLQVSFNRAANESSVSAYRILVVKAANVGNVSLTSANAVPMANYTSVSPNGSNISLTLPASARDIDGDLVANNVPYHVLILSVADGTNANFNSLSLPSNSVTLTAAAIVTADVASNITATQFTNTDSITVAFNRAADESGISQYRVIFVKSSTAGGFNLSNAASVPTGRFISVSPNGNNVSLGIPNGLGIQDADGDALAYGSSYQVFVLSVANGNPATINALAAPSAAFIYNEPIGVSERLSKVVSLYASGKKVHVRYKHTSNVQARLQILNMEGRMVYQTNIESSRVDIPIQWPTGVYLLRLEDQGEVLTQKVYLYE